MTTSNIKAVIQWDIHKVWETVSAVERYDTWRSDVSKTEFKGEKQFTEYIKNGYSTTFTVTVAEPNRRWELDVENSHIKGHWTIVFASKGSETEIDFTACAAAKQLCTRPVGKSVFEQTYLKKVQAQFITDLKKAACCT
ncbi:MAG: SRPBCC family protein [Clostridium sp.]|nr:SRPBCC family protein [Clostridium sp.]